MSSTPTTNRTDIVILGGGIAGLWLLNVLRRQGYRSLLLESNALGAGQTIASQGMIHGGIKYALGGFATESSETIADMPALWRQCIAGDGLVDLRGVELLSEDYYLFSDGKLTSRLSAFFGSKSLRGRVTPVKKKDYPPGFSDPRFKGALYRLNDLVLDTRSLIDALYRPHADRIFKADAKLVGGSGDDTNLVFEDGSRLRARYYILAAGAGNERLLSEAGLGGVSMQRRPLHQVMVKSPHLPPLYAHAVALASGTTPRMTVTTHRAGDGENVWYLGGDLAESGVARGETQQLDFARRELETLVPWFSPADCHWATFRIDRAEPAQAQGNRPDRPFVAPIGNVLVCWPTKLTLAPLLAGHVISLLEDPDDQIAESLPDLDTPAIAKPPWDQLF